MDPMWLQPTMLYHLDYWLLHLRVAGQAGEKVFTWTLLLLLGIETWEGVVPYFLRCGERGLVPAHESSLESPGLGMVGL